MSQPVVADTEIRRSAVKPLPSDAQIESFQPAHPGWFAYYFADGTRMACPIAAWALVMYDVKQNTPRGPRPEQLQEIRPFVATMSGAVVDLLAVPHTLVCVLGPGIPDHNIICDRLLSEFGLVATPEKAPTPSGN